MLVFSIDCHRSCSFLLAVVSNECSEKNDDKEEPPRTGTDESMNPIDKLQHRFSKLGFSARKPSTGANRQAFLLCGRRRKKSKTYLIGSDPFDISRDNCVAKLKSNVLGTQFNAVR